MNWRRILLILPAVVILAGWPAPTHAQSPYLSPPTTYSPFTNPDTTYPDVLGVRLRQNSSGGDEVEIYGSRIENTFDNTYMYNLARSVGDALGLERSETDIDTRAWDSADSDGEPATEIQINVDGRLSERQGDNWLLHVPTAQLLVTAQRYQFSELNLGVCPVLDNAIDQSSRPADDGRSTDPCKWWRQSVATSQSQAVDVKVLEMPDEGEYWTLVSYLGLSVVVMTLISLAITLWLRRKYLKTLGAANLITAVTAVFGAVFMLTVAAVGIILVEAPIDNLVLAKDLDVTGHMLAVLLPALLFTIPLTLAAIVLVCVPPPDRTVKTVMAGAPYSAPQQPLTAPGVPSWLTPAPAPQPQTQQYPVSQAQPPPPPVPSNPEPQQPQPQPERPEPVRQPESEPQRDDEPPPPPPSPWWHPPA